MHGSPEISRGKNSVLTQIQELLLVLYAFISFLCASAGMFFLIAVMADILPLGYLHPVTLSSINAVTHNFLLTLLFVAQHSLMARDKYKRWYRKVFGDRCLRSTYVLTSGLITMFILLYWQPIEGHVWIVADSYQWLFWLGFLGGLLVVIAALFAIDFAHFFGIRQVFMESEDEHTHKLQIKGLYQYSRHPIMLGLLIVLWCVPDMSATKLSLSLLMTVYIFIGLYFEEQALVRHFGDDYRNYQNQVGKILSLPWWKS